VIARDGTIIVRQHYGQLKMLLMKAEQDANKSTGKCDPGIVLKQAKVRRRRAAIETFCHLHGFFTNQNKFVQNTVLFDRAQKSIIAKSTTLEREFKKSGFDAGSMPSDGHAFEYWVAENLVRFGWSAQVTSGSGDQGIDVLATFENKNLAVQCKRYTGSVGNKAVQEAYSGCTFYKADAAAVITNGTFTKSARALADSAGVLLCSLEEIPTLSGAFLRHLDR